MFCLKKIKLYDFLYNEIEDRVFNNSINKNFERVSYIYNMMFLKPKALFRFYFWVLKF